MVDFAKLSFVQAVDSSLIRQSHCEAESSKPRDAMFESSEECELYMRHDGIGIYKSTEACVDSREIALTISVMCLRPLTSSHRNIIRVTILKG